MAGSQQKAEPQDAFKRVVDYFLGHEKPKDAKPKPRKRKPKKPSTKLRRRA
jgi:hypothetical protein